MVIFTKWTRGCVANPEFQDTEITQKNTKIAYMYSTMTQTQGAVLEQKVLNVADYFALFQWSAQHKERIWLPA